MLLKPYMVETRFHPSQEAPQWFKEYMAQGGMQTATGVTVTPDTAMRVTGALACIRTIADTEASLPYFTYRRLERGKEKASEHYLYPILHDIANPEMSAFTFRRTLTAHCASRGNGLAEIEFDGGGRVKALWPLNPDKISMYRQPGTRKLIYVVTLPESEGGGESVLKAERVFHLKWLSQNGLWAMSPVEIAAESIGISLAAQEFTGRFFANDASPRGVLEAPGALSDKAYERLEASWDDKHGGLENRHRLAILEEGLKFNPVSLSPQDVMLLDLMKFGIEDVGRIWGISSDMLNLPGASSTYASVEQFGIRFTTHTIRPWVVNWDQEVNRSLLTENERKTYFVEHDLNGLLRGDFATRMRGYQTAVVGGWQTRNEVREKENENPLDGLDEPLLPLNMSTVADVEEEKEKPEEEPQPTEPVVVVAESQPPEEDENQVPEDNQRAALLPIFEDIFQRIRRRESHDIEAAQKRCKDDAHKFEQWVNEFMSGDHCQFVALQLLPALRAQAALNGKTPTDQEIQGRAKSLATDYCHDALAKGITHQLEQAWPQALADGGLLWK